MTPMCLLSRVIGSGERAEGWEGDFEGEKMEELIARLEKAMGPDRELDGLIFKAVYQRDEDFWTTFGDDNVWHRRDPHDHVAYDPPTNYTTSIDAALTLVPEEYKWTVGITGGGFEFFATVRHPNEGNNPAWRWGAFKTATPAIAMCIAAIAARIADVDDRTEPAKTETVA